MIVKWVVEEEEVGKEERQFQQIDNVELDDLTDSDDELWLIYFELLSDVIYCLSNAQ